MDMRSLMRWRRTCKTHYEVAVRTIDQELGAMVEVYVPSRTFFMAVLHECRAVIGGEAALAFFLRDPTVLSRQLDVYAGSQDGPALVTALTDSWGQFRFTQESYRGRNHHLAVRTDIRRDVHLRCKQTGLEIIIHIANTRCALSPITRTWATALCNYVGVGRAGCGYPSLTLERRSLLARLPSHHFGESDVEERLLRPNAGFQFARTAAMWPEYVRRGQLPVVATGAWRSPCLREAFLCPYQGRYFGDRGSLVDVFDVLGVVSPMLDCTYLPPYGIGCVWRMQTGMLCDGPCSGQDDYLPPEVTSCVAIIVGVGSSRVGPPPSTFSSSSLVFSSYTAGFRRTRSWSF